MHVRILAPRQIFRHVVVVALLTACAGPRVGTPRPRQGIPIDTLELRAHTSFLAHDALAGRETGTPGGQLAARYIASQCRRLGLTVHELPVPLRAARLVPDASRLTAGDQSYRAGGDFVPAGGTARALRGFRGVPVWAGTSDDIAAAESIPDLSGRVMLTAGPVRPAAAGRLAAHNAEGMLHLVADSGTWDLYRASRGGRVLTLDAPGAPSSFHADLPGLIASPSLSRALLDAARAGSAVDVELAFTWSAVDAHNVACLKPGADSIRPWIALTAHYDHLGIGVPSAEGDSIYNGFSDNAAGVAMLLAIARALADAPLVHPVALMFFTGEERGLLGSDYYVHRPLIPLGRTLAVINLDAGAPPARPWSWRLAGGDASPLGALARDVAAARGWSATTSPATPNSDYFPFHRRGVPAVFIIPGSAPYEGLDADSSAALRERWDRYHQPDDHWHPDFPFAGLARYAEYALRLMRAVDGNPGLLRRP